MTIFDIALVSSLTILTLFTLLGLGAWVWSVLEWRRFETERLAFTLLNGETWEASVLRRSFRSVYLVRVMVFDSEGKALPMVGEAARLPKRQIAYVQAL